MLTVYLKDCGQDFLEWDIEDGVVIECRPFQGWLWNGTQVHNTDIQAGDILEITPRTGGRTTLNYPVEKVMEKGNRRGSYLKARGASPRKPGAPLPEEVIRRGRGG